MPLQSLELALLLLIERRQDLWENDTWNRLAGNAHPYELPHGHGNRMRDFGSRVAAVPKASQQEAMVKASTPEAETWKVVAKQLAEFTGVRDLVRDAVQAGSARQRDQANLTAFTAMSKVTLSQMLTSVAGKLFGCDPTGAIERNLEEFCEAVLHQEWMRERARKTNAKNKLEKMKTRITKRWEHYENLPTLYKRSNVIESLQGVTTRYREALAILGREGDGDEFLEEWRGTLEKARDTLQLDLDAKRKQREAARIMSKKVKHTPPRAMQRANPDKSQVALRTPTAMRILSRDMVKPHEAKATLERMAAVLNAIDPRSAALGLVAKPVDVGNWVSGTEQLEHLSMDEAWAMLGVPRDRIPGMATSRDPDGAVTAWDRSEWTNLKARGKVVPVELKWIQVIAVVRLAEIYFTQNDGRALVLDNVGLGKTITVLSFFAYLFASKLSKIKKGDKYLGKFADSKAAIPLQIFVVVCDPSLVAQWVHAARIFLQWGIFEVMPYYGGKKSLQFFDKVYGRAGAECKVLIVSSSAVGSLPQLFEVAKNNWEQRQKKADFERLAADTPFSLEYCVAVYDEAHGHRNYKAGYWLCRGIGERAQFRMALTATPAPNTAADLHALGRLLGMSEFGAAFEETEKDYLREFRAAIASDKATRDDALRERAHEPRRSVTDDSFLVDDADDDEDADYMSQDESGRYASKGSAKTAVEHVTTTHVATVRKHFEPFVIRRDHSSKDFNGNPVLSLPEKKEIYLRVSLYDDEKRLYAAAVTGVKGNSAAALVDMLDSKPNEAFGFELRQQVAHPAFPRKPTMPFPTEPEEFESFPTSKILTAVAVARWHLSKDRTTSLMTDRSGQLTGYENEFPSLLERHADLPAIQGRKTKIVIFSAFPTRTKHLKRIFKWWGVSNMLELDGSLSAQERDRVLEQFKTKTKHRVLWLSSVGITGLNLSVACVLILFDRCWCWTDIVQLSGRIWRFPQRSVCFVYHVIARGTIDDDLVALARRKSVVHSVFLNQDASEIKSDDEDEDEEDEEPAFILVDNATEADGTTDADDNETTDANDEVTTDDYDEEHEEEDDENEPAQLTADDGGRNPAADDQVSSALARMTTNDPEHSSDIDVDMASPAATPPDSADMLVDAQPATPEAPGLFGIHQVEREGPQLVPDIFAADIGRAGELTLPDRFAISDEFPESPTVNIARQRARGRLVSTVPTTDAQTEPVAGPLTQPAAEADDRGKSHNAPHVRERIKWKHHGRLVAAHAPLAPTSRQDKGKGPERSKRG